MADFFLNFPVDNDISIGYGSVVELLAGIKANCPIGFINAQPIGKGESLQDYGFSVWFGDANPVSEAPFILAQWTGGPDRVHKVFHFDNALKGTLDWSLAWAPVNTVWDKSVDGATYDLFAANFAAWTSGFQPNIQLADLNGQAMAASLFAVETQTDGPNAGLVWGFRHNWQFNPSASQFTAGQKPAFGAAFYQINFREADLNLFGVNGDANLAQSPFPVVNIQGDSQDQGWTDLSGGVGDINTAVQILNTWATINNVTNVGDLGQVGAPDAQPGAPQVTFGAFAAPGALTVIETTPTILRTMATGAGLIWSAIYGLGRSSLEFLGLVGPATAAATSIPTGMAQLNNLGPLVVELHDVHLELDDIQQDTFLIRGELNAINDALKTKSLPADPDTLYDVLNNLALALSLLAETKTDLTLRAKGIEVQAISGSLTTNP